MGQEPNELGPILSFCKDLPFPTHLNSEEGDLETKCSEPEAFQSIDTGLNDLGEKENWTLRICPAFVQTINEIDWPFMFSVVSFEQTEAVKFLFFVVAIVVDFLF